jgi:hypothetical protein
MSDPVIDRYKLALTQLGVAIKPAHKTKEGKQLPADYWIEVVNLLKKAKLGIAMIELGIDDESEIATTHDISKETPPTQEPALDESSRDTNSKSGAIGSKTESKGDLDVSDAMNHLSILLSEQCDSIKLDDTHIHINTNNHTFTIQYKKKFFMISEDYNFELGDTSDIQSVVDTFVKLSMLPIEHLRSGYTRDLVS